MISKRILSDFLTLWTIYNNGTQKRQPHQTAFFVYFNMQMRTIYKKVKYIFGAIQQRFILDCKST